MILVLLPIGHPKYTEYLNYEELDIYLTQQGGVKGGIVDKKDRSKYAWRHLGLSKGMLFKMIVYTDYYTNGNIITANINYKLHRFHDSW